MKEKKHRLQRLWNMAFNTKMGSIVFSVLVAVILWFTISINVYPTTPKTIAHIPVIVDITGSAAEQNGYSVIEYSTQEVTVQIEGNRSQIGNLDADNMEARAVIGNITSSGVKTLDINIVSKDGTEFTVKALSPKTMNVRFERLRTQKFPIHCEIPNVTNAAGCLINTEEIEVTPAEIEVTGPENVLSRISYAAAVVPQERELAAAAILITEQLEFRDADGIPIEDSYLDYTTTHYAVEIPVQYTQELDVAYQLRNVPANFNEAYLRSLIKQSLDKITIAASDASLNSETAFSIGQISLSEIGMNFSRDLVLEVPETYENLSGVTSVNLALDSTDLVERTFTVTDISIANAPTTYEMWADTGQLTVTMVGKRSQMEQLSAEDLKVTVNLLGASLGSTDTLAFNFTPTISCEKWDSVWAVGDYTNKVYVRGQRTENTTASTTEQKTVNAPMPTNTTTKTP